MPPLSGVPAYRYKQSLSRCITRYRSGYLRSTVTFGKTPIMQLEVNISRFVAMLLLHNKDQQQNNPLASLATCPRVDR